MGHSNQIADPLDCFVRDSFAVIRGITMLSGYVIKPINDSTCEMAYIVQVRCLPYRSRRVLSSVYTHWLRLLGVSPQVDAKGLIPVFVQNMIAPMQADNVKR